jgi:hypothetical protein
MPEAEGFPTNLQNVYEYRKGAKVCCDAERSFVENLIKPDEFALLFGGWMLSKGSEKGIRYLGVWGHRNAGRFRRILRERGAQISIVRSQELQRSLLMTHTFPAPYHKNRIALKRSKLSK